MEAREQVEHKLGQTFSLDQHWLRFSKYLELMPQGRHADGELVRNETQSHSINHVLVLPRGSHGSTVGERSIEKKLF